MRQGFGICMICHKYEFVNNIIIPCGHNGYCEKCIAEWRKKSNTCPFCRDKIEKVTRVYD